MVEKHSVIIGLGNPGKKYEMTRHNMGFLVAKEFARKLGLSFKVDKQVQAFIAKGFESDTTIHVLMPTTYMNLSGAAVRSYLDYYKLTAEQIIVVSDDIALSFGQLRIRDQGSSGGHNGLKSIAAHLGTTHFTRLRMGIGSHLKSDESLAPLADYVLGDFTRDELNALDAFIDLGAQTLMRLIKEPIVSVMNAVNVKQNVKQSVKQEIKRIEANPQHEGQEKNHDSK